MGRVGPCAMKMSIHVPTTACIKCGAVPSCSPPAHQIDELNALESIFPGEFKLIANCPIVELIVTLPTEVSSAYGDRTSIKQHQPVTIVFKLPPTYPESDVPDISVGKAFSFYVYISSESIFILLFCACTILTIVCACISGVCPCLTARWTSGYFSCF